MTKAILVYGRENCPYCDKTKEYLNSLNIPYTYVDITNWDRERKEKLKSDYNVKTVPVIIINGMLIGGYTELTQQLHLV